MVSGVARERLPATAVILGVLGLVPFAAALYLAVAGNDGPRLAIIHAALLLAFFGGIRWAVSIIGRSRLLPFDLTAGAMAVLVGLAATILPIVLGLCLLIAGLLTQALWDEMSAGSGSLPGWFGKLRMLLTTGTGIAILVMLGERLFR